MKLKLTIIVAAFASIISSNAGIPVVDPANIAQAAKQVQTLVKTARDNIKYYKETINNYKNIIKNAEQQVMAVTGITDVRDIINDVENLKKNFKIDPKNLVKDFIDLGNFDDLVNGKGKLTGNIISKLPPEQKAVIKKMTNQTCPKLNSAMQDYCSAQAIVKSESITKLSQYALRVNESVKQFEKIIKKASSTTSLKESTDMTNQILIFQTQFELQDKKFQQLIEETKNTESDLTNRLNSSLKMTII